MSFLILVNYRIFSINSPLPRIIPNYRSTPQVETIIPLLQVLSITRSNFK
ncbi:unnamed protein product [Meloidogyne enterolobii]|uniref:Uncharacterized protein n=1 Tax=Meloidogyne enterolobii TaxID=390850 RepID=A0ACB0YTJ7_MELEN